jgi:hypothetical protein
VLFDCASNPISQFAVSLRQLFQNFVGPHGPRTFDGAKLHKLSNVEFVLAYARLALPTVHRSGVL